MSHEKLAAVFVVVIGALIALRMVLAYLRASHLSAGHAEAIHRVFSEDVKKLGARVEALTVAANELRERMMHLQNRIAG